MYQPVFNLCLDSSIVIRTFFDGLIGLFLIRNKKCIGIPTTRGCTRFDRKQSFESS